MYIRSRDQGSRPARQWYGGLYYTTLYYTILCSDILYYTTLYYNYNYTITILSTCSPTPTPSPLHRPPRPRLGIGLEAHARRRLHLAAARALDGHLEGAALLRLQQRLEHGRHGEQALRKAAAHGCVYVYYIYVDSIYVNIYIIYMFQFQVLPVRGYPPPMVWSHHGRQGPHTVLCWQQLHEQTVL